MRRESLSVHSFAASFIACLLCCLCILVPGSGRAEKPAGELLIGIEPEHNIFDQVQRYRFLATYLSDQLGVKVRLTIMSRYGEVIKRFRSRKLDGAFLSAYTAALGIREIDLRPIASPVNLNGESTSRGYIFVRKDSGIKNGSGMRQRSIAFVDPATMEGYIYPLAYLREQGVADPDSFFSRQYFTGSHASTVFAVLDGRADVGSAKDTVYNKMVENDPSIGQELLVLGQSVKVPEVTLCVRGELPVSLREKLGAVLLRMEKTSRGKKVLRQFEALRFIKTTKSDFYRIEEMVQESAVNKAEHQNKR